MRNLKRVLSLALALVMVLGMMVIGTSAATFTDADEITYTEAVEVMAALGVLAGDGTGNFNPKGDLNRAGAAKLIAFMTMGADADDYLTGSAATFTDVAADHWAAKYVAYCSNLGIINGNGDGTFNPDGKISVVGFAKLVLGAIEAEGTFTGAGWEDAVKKAFNAVPELKATGIKITTANITREEASALMLAGMKAGEDYSNGWYYEGKVAELGYAASYSEMYIMANTLVQGFDATKIKKHSDTRDSLLETTYKIDCYRDTDAFGRPGTRYEYVGNDETIKTNLFFQDTAVKSYTGTVLGGALWADLGKPEDAVNVTAYVDGKASINSTNTKIESLIVKDDKTPLQTNYGTMLTGNSVATEVYAAGENAYVIVIINTYTDVVDTVNEAQGETKANIVLANATDLKTIETDKFAENDVVLYTKGAHDGTKYTVQSIEKAEAAVSGTPTKLANGAYTIGEGSYKLAVKNTVTIELGTEGEWYVDAYGNLIANKGAQQQQVRPTYYYGYLKDYAVQAYAPANSGNLLGEGATEEKEAKEVFQFINAAGEVVTLNGAVEVTKVGRNYTTDFVADAWATTEESGEVSDVLFRYELDENGNIKSVYEATSKPNAVATMEQGKATHTGSNLLLTDETVFFFVTLDEGKVDEFVAAIGYDNIPEEISGTVVARFYDDTKGVMQAVVMTVASLEEAPETDDYNVFFASESYTTEWDATANNGQGGTYVLYEEVYVDGVKVEGGLKFAAAQSVTAGEMYAVTVTDGMAALDDGLNLLTGTDIITNVQSGYFKAGSIVYTNADTVYFQVDEENTTIAKVAGLPTVEEDEAIKVLKVVVPANKTVASVVYIAVVDAQ